MDTTQIVAGWSVFILCWAGLFAVLWWKGEGFRRGFVALGWSLFGLGVLYSLMHLALHLS